MDATLRYFVLGPLEVRRGDAPVPVTRAKVRGLLALLLLHGGEVLSAERLTEALWGGRPPEDARTALQVHVSRLRSTLGADALRTTSGGYVLDLDAEQVDALRFERLLAQGREALRDNRPDEAAHRLREALALWRGDVLADVEIAETEAATVRLEEERQAATEDLFEAELARGRHAELVAPLEEALAEWPFRERLWRQLMLAHYRAGRQVDALAAYGRARALLDERLGLEPGPELRSLERAILLHDPSLRLDWTEPPALQEARTAIRALERVTAYLPDADVARLSLLPQLGESLMDLGEWTAAAEVLDEAARTAVQLGRPVEAAHARLVAVRLQLRTEPAADVDELRDVTRDTIEVFRRAGDDRRLAEAWAIHAGVLWRGCRAAETEHALERAIELAGATGDRRAEERALHLLIGALVLGPTPVPLAIERCLAIRREHEERAYVAAAAERGLALLHAMLGDFATARTHVANDKALLARIDSPVAATDAASPHAAVALESGDAEEAERELRGAHDELVTIGERSMRTAVAAELANVLAELGRHDEALSFAEEAGEDAPPLHLTAQVPRRLAQSRVHRERGDGETAERFAREAVELAGRSDFLPLLASSYLELAYVLRMHDAAAARSAARRAQRAAQRKRHTVLARRAAAV